MFKRSPKVAFKKSIFSKYSYNHPELSSERSHTSLAIPITQQIENCITNALHLAEDILYTNTLVRTVYIRSRMYNNKYPAILGKLDSPLNPSPRVKSSVESST